MKIIQPGSLERAAPWWMKVRIECRRCGAVFKLDETDRPRTWDDQRDGQGGQIACPTCKDTVNFYPATGPMNGQ